MPVDPALIAAQQQVQAAWVQTYTSIVQAILSVGAIVAAIYIAKADRMHEKAQRATHERRVARDLAILIAPELRPWELELKRTLRAINGDIDGTDGVAMEMVYDDLLGGQLEATFFPARLADRVGKFRELGGAAEPVMDAYALKSEIDEVVRAIKRFRAKSLGKPESELRPDLMKAAKRFCIAALAACDAINHMAQPLSSGD